MEPGFAALQAYLYCMSNQVRSGKKWHISLIIIFKVLRNVFYFSVKANSSNFCFKKKPSFWYLGFLGGTRGKEATFQCRGCRFPPRVGKIPWRRAWQPTPILLPGEAPWAEEPGGLRLQRVGHDWSDLAHTHTCIHSDTWTIWTIKIFCSVQVTEGFLFHINIWHHKG